MKKVKSKVQEVLMRQTTFLPLRKFLAPEFVFGQGAVALAGRYATNLGGHSVLLVSDPGVIRVGLTELVRTSLEAQGLAVTEFFDVSPNPRDFEVMAGAALYARQGCDMLVAVGGGSAMDCAKAIGIVTTNASHVLSFEGADNVPLPGPPLVCIPTTAGSAADVSQFAIITDTQRKVKIAIVSKTMVPDVSLLDPELTLSMGTDLTAHTGLDALTHAVEAYVSNAHSPTTDLLALEAVRLVGDNLPKVLADPDNLELRARMLHASLWAGLAFSNAILGAVHAMAHSLGGFLDLPHGLCNALLLEHVVKRTFACASKRFADVARALGGEVDLAAPDGGCRDVVQAFRRMRLACGVTRSLAEMGVTLADVPHLAVMAVHDPCMATNPCPLDVAEVEAIFVGALRDA